MDEKLEEIIVPDHHRIFSYPQLLAGHTERGELDIYGTSTILNILMLDGKVEELNDLEEEIRQMSEKIRGLFTHLFNIDDMYNEEDDELYMQNTVFSKISLCKFNMSLVLLPFTVSKDTFNTCFPIYERLILLHSNYKERYEEIESSVSSVSSASSASSISSFFKKKPPTIVKYKKACADYLKGLKEYIRLFLSNDDFLINTYKHIAYIFDDKKPETKDFVSDLIEITNENKIALIGEKVLSDIKNLYTTRYVFNEVVENGIKYKLIPEDFLFYRSYPSCNTPFSTHRPYTYVGFSFNEIIGYTRPHEKDLKELTGEEYCKLLGLVSTLKTDRQLKLVDMGHIDTLKEIFKLMNTETKQAFNKVWKLEMKDGVEIIKRKSNLYDDSTVSQWLYDNDFEGYIGYGVIGLHDECVITRDKSKEHLIEKIPGFGMKFPLKIVNTFPMKNLIPLCQDPFNLINYRISME